MNPVPSATLDDLHRRIGRSLLRFQQIESALKFALPYMHPEGGRRGLEALKAYREQIRTKPLGEVIRALQESTPIPEGFFTKTLQEVVDARNAFVHHLFEQPGIDLMTPTVLTDLARYLDEQYEQTAELFEFSRALCGATPLALHHNNPGAYPEIETHRAPLEASLPSVTWAEEEDLSPTTAESKP